MQRLRHIRSRIRRNHFAKESSVSEGETAGSINPNNVLIVIPHLHNGSGFVPFLWMCPGLILDSDSITDMERLELMRLSLQPLHLSSQSRLESMLLS